MGALAADVVRVVEEVVKGVMSPDPVHGYPHVIRVRDLALRIGRAYAGRVDAEVLELAALLHDVSRGSFSDGLLGGDHALASARVAEALLKALGYPEPKAEAVAHAILTHSYSSGRVPETLEARILSDADKLDALGAIGVARVFMYSGALGRGLRESVEHFRKKILRLPELMWTPEGREEALRRVEFVRSFLKELEAEVGGF